MNQRYPVPVDRHLFEEAIQRSRFLTTLAPAGTVAEAVAFIDEMRGRYPDATHHCWAYLVGPPGSSVHVGMSDDGEPHGTAGRPMLHVLHHGGVGDIAAVVTRWYGGTKLGKGGLVRAYSGGVQQALATLPTREKVCFLERFARLPYAHVRTLRRLAGAHEVEITDETYAADVTMTLRVPEDRLSRFSTELVRETAGRVDLEDTGS